MIFKLRVRTRVPDQVAYIDCLQCAPTERKLLPLACISAMAALQQQKVNDVVKHYRPARVGLYSIPLEELC